MSVPDELRRYVPRTDLYDSAELISYHMPIEQPPAIASYIIFRKGNKYYAKNGTYGHIEYENTDLKTLIETVINAVGSSYATIILKDLDEPAGLTVPANVLLISNFGRIINLRSTYPVIRLCGENGANGAAEITFMAYSHVAADRAWADIKVTRDGIWHFLTDRTGTAEPPNHIVFEIDGEAEGTADNEIFEVIRDGWVGGTHTKMFRVEAAKGITKVENDAVNYVGQSADFRIMLDGGYFLIVSGDGIRTWTDGEQKLGTSGFRFKAIILKPLSAEPTDKVEGMICIADGTNWDPAGKGTGVSYPVYYDGTSWHALY